MARLKSFGWFCLALLLLVLLLWPAPEDALQSSRPVTTDRDWFGLAALTQWLEAAAIPTVSLRQRFTERELTGLDRAGAAAGNLLFVHLPATLLYEAEEVRSMLRWVSAGNTLVIATGHLEGSPWVYTGTDLERSLWRLTGLELAYVPDTASRSGAGEAIAMGDPENTETAEQREAQEAAKKTMEAAKDDRSLTESISDTIGEALVVPGWVLAHGSRETVSVVPVGEHPLTRRLTDLEVPWDGARWYRRPAASAVDEPEVPAPLLEEPDPEDTEDADANQSAADDDSEVPAYAADQAACLAERTQSPGTHWLRGDGGCLALPVPEADAWQVVLRHGSSEQPVAYEAALAEGSVVVVLHASLFGNGAMHRFSNRRFTMRLIEQALGTGNRGGAASAVLFDDAHQGLNDIVEANDILEDPRFYWSIAFLLAFWVAYLFADDGRWARARHREPVPAAGQRSLIAAGANFMQQRMHHSAAVEAILEPLRDQLAHKWQLAADQALSEGLRFERPGREAAVEALELSLGRLRQGRKVSLYRLRREVLRLQRAMN